MQRSTGQFLLASATIMLFGFAIYDTIATSLWQFIATMPFMALLIVGFLQIYQKTVFTKSKLEIQAMFRLFIAVLLGAVFTHYLVIYGNLSAVIASAALGLFAAVVLKKDAVALYCGSFVGMACPLALSFPYLVLAGIIAGIVYILAEGTYTGVGGKLGTTAFVGTTVVALFGERPLTSAPIPDFPLWMIIIAVAMAGAVFTFSLQHRYRQSAVFASAFLGLLGGFLFPLIHPTSGGTLAIVFFCATFIGMASKTRLHHEGHALIAGVIAGGFFLLTMPRFGGAGGKLGTIAFGSVIMTMTIIYIYTTYFRRQKA